jgi:hypothetical protein
VAIARHGLEDGIAALAGDAKLAVNNRIRVRLDDFQGNSLNAEKNRGARVTQPT